MAIQLRPRFRRETALSTHEIGARLRQQLERPNSAVTGTLLEEFIVLRMRPEAEHFWSPELTLQLHAEPEGGTLIRALFGPRPAVWTGFAGFYTFAIFISCMALLFGLSQWSLGMAPIGLWLLPLPILLLISAYGIALIGQRLGHDQMAILQEVFDQALDQAPVIAEGTGASDS